MSKFIKSIFTLACAAGLLFIFACEQSGNQSKGKSKTLKNTQ